MLNGTLKDVVASIRHLLTDDGNQAKGHLIFEAAIAAIEDTEDEDDATYEEPLLM